MVHQGRTFRLRRDQQLSNNVPDDTHIINDHNLEVYRDGVEHHFIIVIDSSQIY